MDAREAPRRHWGGRGFKTSKKPEPMGNSLILRGGKRPKEAAGAMLVRIHPRRERPASLSRLVRRHSRKGGGRERRERRGYLRNNRRRTRRKWGNKSRSEKAETGKLLTASRNYNGDDCEVGQKKNGAGGSTGM